MWKGGSAMLAAMTLLARGDSSREIVLFDTFKGMVEPTAADVRVGGSPAHEKWKPPSATIGTSGVYAGLDEVRQHAADGQIAGTGEARGGRGGADDSRAGALGDRGPPARPTGTGRRSRAYAPLSSPRLRWCHRRRRLGKWAGPAGGRASTSRSSRSSLLLLRVDGGGCIGVKSGSDGESDMVGDSPSRRLNPVRRIPEA